MAQKKLLFLPLFALGLVISCSKDDGASTPPNTAPVIKAQTFSAAENITDAATIGTVTATDADKDDTLTFTMITNDDNLFEIDLASGKLSLAPGKSLDFETAEGHSIIVAVTDGVNDPVSAEITITVTNIIESLVEDPASFVTIWVTTANNESIKIGVDPDFTYDYTIDWGDGTVENITYSSFAAQHEYAQPGTHTVAIKGTFPAILMDKYAGLVTEADALKLASIEQWGTNPWASMYGAFIDCGNMVYNATDVPDLSQVTDMGSMFAYTSAFNGDISGWDVSNVTNMGSMFAYADAFNGDISGWDVSSVTHMGRMFLGAVAFNGDISGWDVSNVTDMSRMFSDADTFNGNLGAWDISSVTDMTGMLSGSGLSPDNYSSTLEGWANPNAPQGLTLSATGLQYCDNVSTGLALSYLTNDKGWTITDDGFVNCN